MTSPAFPPRRVRALVEVMAPAPKVCVVYVTAPADEASALARALVERRVAACVNLTPVQSIYRWENQIQNDAETLLIIKTTPARFDALRDAVLELHRYDVPEVLALPVHDASSAYASWVGDEVRGPA